MNQQAERSSPAAELSPLSIRHCHGFEELELCVALQTATWGYDPVDVVPRRLFTVAQRIGGQVIGAFAPDGTLSGFTLAIPGLRNGMPFLHSHMLAVRSEYRNTGVGRRLKLFQREDALSRGIRLIEWTFDPLEIKNSFFNIEKLGAITRSYSPNFYGPSSAKMQGGRPTDRLHAEWWLESERVIEAVAGRRPSRMEPEERIELPAEVMQWKESVAMADQAMARQSVNERRFMEAFARGLVVTGFSRDEKGNGYFELSRWTPPPASDAHHG